MLWRSSTTLDARKRGIWCLRENVACAALGFAESWKHLKPLLRRIKRVNARKKLEADGPFAGLWIRTANALRGGGYTSRARARVGADIMSGKLRAFCSIHDYGSIANIEVITWLLNHDELSSDEVLAYISSTYGEDKRARRSPRLRKLIQLAEKKLPPSVPVPVGLPVEGGFWRGAPRRDAEPVSPREWEK